MQCVDRMICGLADEFERWPAGGGRKVIRNEPNTVGTELARCFVLSALLRSMQVSCGWLHPFAMLALGAGKTGRGLHVQSDICDIVHSVPPRMRLCAGHSGTTLDIVHAEDRPPIIQRTLGLSATG